MFSALNNLCSNLMHAAQGQAGDARQATLLRALGFGSEALVLAQASGNGHREAVCQGNLAVVQTGLGDYAAAQRIHRLIPLVWVLYLTSHPYHFVSYFTLSTVTAG